MYKVTFKKLLIQVKSEVRVTNDLKARIEVSKVSNEDKFTNEEEGLNAVKAMNEEEGQNAVKAMNGEEGRIVAAEVVNVEVITKEGAEVTKEGEEVMKEGEEGQTSFLPMPTIETLANGATGENLNPPNFV